MRASRATAKQLAMTAIAVSFAGLHCSSGPAASGPTADAGSGEASKGIAKDADAPKPDVGTPDSQPRHDAAKSLEASTGDDAGDAEIPGWTLTWSDEFNGADGTAPDSTYWSHDVGGDGWGNDELEYYTDGASNTYMEGGNLVIVATTDGASAYTCANDGASGPCQYTSGRIVTEARGGNTGFSQTYGRFEARMKLPAGTGLWPAFWMLGTNIETVSWPACGEIDLMENLGQAPTTVYGHLHMASSGGNYGPGTAYTLPSGSFADEFHIFAIEWQMGAVDFFVDGAQYDSISAATTPSDATWAFDGHPFFIVMNLAVGSKDSWPGAPDPATVFPAKVLVDYVRVYEKK
jgi:beta-glucanase (GH16 family)